jgi:tRNA (guanine-N1)-methyltransferase
VVHRANTEVIMRIDIVTIFPEYFGPASAGAGPLGVSLIGKAAARGDVNFHIHDLRQWATDVHHTVDDTPFGGGPGMVMKADVWGDAVDAILSAEPNSAAGPATPSASSVGPSASGTPLDFSSSEAPSGADTPFPPSSAGSSAPDSPLDYSSSVGLSASGSPLDVSSSVAPSGADTPLPPSTAVPSASAGPSATTNSSVTRARLVVPTPSGVPFTQEMALAYAGERHLVFACGRYEGIDGRVVEDARGRGMAVDEVSIGDYVLAGGEAAVVVIVEAVCRLLPGVLGNERSVSDDSFGGGSGAMHGLLEGPVYTRPRGWRGREVPAVLLSGDHAAIARWQRDEALRRTAERRPDLIRRLAAGDGLDARDRAVLIQAGFPVDGESMAH